MVERLAVRRDRRAVGDRDLGRRGDAGAVGGEAVDGAGGLALAIVHRAEPEPTLGIDGAVVQAVAGQAGLRIDQRRKAAVRRIERGEAGLQPRDEAAARCRKRKAHLGRRIPARLVAGGGIIAVDLVALDVDEPQRGVALHPHRAFEKRGAEPPHALRRRNHHLVGHLISSLHPRRIRGSLSAAHRRMQGTAPARRCRRAPGGRAGTAP